jgi:hypothetical protein
MTNMQTDLKMLNLTKIYNGSNCYKTYVEFVYNDQSPKPYNDTQIKHCNVNCHEQRTNIFCLVSVGIQTSNLQGCKRFTINSVMLPTM